MLHEEVALYAKLTGNDAENTPVCVIGAYLDGYEKGKTDAYQWIPCSERLPKQYEEVLVYKPGNEDEGIFEEYDIACVWEQEKYDDSGDLEIMWCGKEFKYPLEDVEKWMPLPV